MAVALNPSGQSVAVAPPAEKGGHAIPWKALAPIAVALIIAAFPPPEGLAQHAWYFFADLRRRHRRADARAAARRGHRPDWGRRRHGARALGAVRPAELAKAGFKPANASDSAGLCRVFPTRTVWLIFAAFMFALGYEKTGLGRRIALLLVKAMGRRTLTLGYAVAVADTLLAPFTPSNTARSGGTVYPVIRNLPALYDSSPTTRPSRRSAAI